MDTAVHAVEFVGAATLRGLRAIGRNSRFVAETIGGFRDVSTWPEQTIVQARRLGVDSLRSRSSCGVYGHRARAARELLVHGRGPALLRRHARREDRDARAGAGADRTRVAGRVGANIAAELGTMRVTEQIDALETLGTIRSPFSSCPRACRPGDVPGRRRRRNGHRCRRRRGRLGGAASPSCREFVKGCGSSFKPSTSSTGS